MHNFTTKICDTLQKQAQVLLLFFNLLKLLRNTIDPP